VETLYAGNLEHCTKIS